MDALKTQNLKVSGIRNPSWWASVDVNVTYENPPVEATKSGVFERRESKSIG